MDEYTGEIRIFAGTFAPNNWAYCNGQLLEIRQYSQLYAVIGASYGGDGSRTFALPDLQDKAPMGAGAGPGRTSRKLGDTSKESSYKLDTSTMPAHSHALNGTTVVVVDANPTDAYLGSFPDSRTGKTRYNNSGASTGNLNPATISVTGTADPASVSVMQPYLGVSFIICLNGEFPQRQG
jgi:microcystin-dependent protein